MTNLRDHIIEWLDEIGADGLMKPDWEDGPIAITPDDIMRDKDAHLHLQLVPAYRHADGSYHTEPDKSVCAECSGALFGTCDIKQTQDWGDLYKSWLARRRRNE